ncbi:MAG: UbiH/UbiF family hydroxylase [Rhizobiaceae bacterium]|nr:UbiH/UbiF family hydroxylase [Rhizobiaceae bacterium]
MAHLAVIGTGPAGMLAALSLKRSGHEVALIGPAMRLGDKRTTALMMPSIRVLDHLGIWDSVRPQAAPLKKMRIIDGTKRLLRAPTVTFHAHEIDEEAFGWNIPNDVLNGALNAALIDAGVDRIAETAGTIAEFPAGVTVTLASGATRSFDGIIGADGQDSPSRKAAGIAVRTVDLPQAALVCVFSHGVPHQNISNEIHTETGPCTTVPLPEAKRSSLVWVLRPEEARAKAALPAPELSRQVETRLRSMLGAVSIDADIGAQVWPLSGLIARQAARGRIALIGEAAHRFPPIGAQGLNLSVRDIEALTEHLSRNDGVVTAFSFYAEARASDIRMRHTAVMTLNRTLLTPLLPAQLLRGAGLALLDSVPFLRGIVMREGMQPGSGLARLMPKRNQSGSRPDFSA